MIRRSTPPGSACGPGGRSFPGRGRIVRSMALPQPFSARCVACGPGLLADWCLPCRWARGFPGPVTLRNVGFSRSVQTFSASGHQLFPRRRNQIRGLVTVPVSPGLRAPPTSEWAEPLSWFFREFRGTRVYSRSESGGGGRVRRVVRADSGWPWKDRGEQAHDGTCSPRVGITMAVRRQARLRRRTTT